MYKLNFKMREFLYSETAAKRNIKNIPDVDSLDNLLDLIINTMQPIRNYVNRMIRITSGYRCPELNKAVGGVPTSQHTKGQACDFIIPGLSIEETVQKVIDSGVEYDQLINEYGQWVHISFNKGHNRKQVLKY